MTRSTWRNIGAVALAVGGFLLLRQLAGGGNPALGPTVQQRPPAAQSVDPATAFHDHLNGVEVEAAGVVIRILPDDQEGSPHQRFVVRLPSGQRVLVAHNLGLSSRVPLDVGDPIRVRGEYEWNDLGGVIHWTHRDPQGQHAPGWIEHKGRLIQ